jgi:hypothetical protein
MLLHQAALCSKQLVLPVMLLAPVHQTRAAVVFALAAVQALA